MDGLIILSCFIVAPALLSFVLRANGAIVFLSVCLGSVLATFVSGDASSIISGASRSGALATMQWTQITLLIAPVIAATVLTRKKLKGLKRIFGAVAALCSGSLLALLIMPYLSQATQRSIEITNLWHELDSLQVGIIICGTSITMLLLYMTRWKPDGDKKKHK